MGKKSRKHIRIKEEAFDDFEDLFDDEFDVSELSRGRGGADWGDDYYFEKDFAVDAKRRIERRRDMKKLYSELDEWEEFGDRAAWH